jgi:competence protein ComEC
MPLRFLGWFSWRLINTLAFLICLGYGYISGFSLPTQRALLMLLFGLILLSYKQKISLIDLLMLCLWLVLLIDPLAVLSSSLWLSFTAISAILLFIWILYRPQLSEYSEQIALSRWKRCGTHFFMFVKWLFLLQLTLTILLLPIQLINFSALSAFSFIINLIAIPLFSWLIIPLTLLGALLLVILGPLGSGLLSLSDFLLTHFLAEIQPFSEGYFLFSDLTITMILSSILVILLLLFLIYLYYFFAISKKASVLLVIIFLSFIFLRRYEIAVNSENTWQVEIFDIGQGLAVLVKSGDEVLLYDSGPSYLSYYIAAKSEILPYLQARDIQTLSYLIISHSDNDHAGGANTLLDHLYVKSAYSGEANLMNKKRSTKAEHLNNRVSYQQCLAGQVFNLGKLTLEVLSPFKKGKNDNNNSCVIKVSDGVNSLLLTGDINQEAEQQLITHYANSNNSTLAADILIAPHHGSKTSSSITFIKQVNPRWVIFSAGYKNRWNFPNAKVVQRYQDSGVKQITTGNSGFIRFNVENQHIDVKTYREDLAAYWYHYPPVF